MTFILRCIPFDLHYSRYDETFASLFLHVLSCPFQQKFRAFVLLMQCSLNGNSMQKFNTTTEICIRQFLVLPVAFTPHIVIHYNIMKYYIFTILLGGWLPTCYQLFQLCDSCLCGPH